MRGIDKHKKPAYDRYIMQPTATPIPGLGRGNIINCDSGPFQTVCQLTGNRFGSAFGQVITFAFILAIMIALAFLIWGGIKWVTSGGEKAGVEEARNHVIAAVVGLIIVFLSYFIINLIVYFFTGESLNTIQIPQLKL